MIAEQLSPYQILSWYLEAGVDEAILDTPVNRYEESAAALEAAKARRAAAAPPAAMSQPMSRPTPSARPAVPTMAADSAVRDAKHAAQEAKTLEQLRAAVAAFEGCSLKATATNTVFADGNPDAKVMVIGEAPGADEDRRGVPFIGASGKLLDKMLASIGLDRTNVYITNVLPWRPPGNRKPTPQEVAICLPFLMRHIELMDPQIMLLVGGLSAKTIFGSDQGIMKLRGKWETYESEGLSHPIPAIATFHPAFLLREPRQKRFAWRDLLALKGKLGV